MYFSFAPIIFPIIFPKLPLFLIAVPRASKAQSQSCLANPPVLCFLHLTSVSPLTIDLLWNCYRVVILLCWHLLCSAFSTSHLHLLAESDDLCTFLLCWHCVNFSAVPPRIQLTSVKSEDLDVDLFQLSAMSIFYLNVAAIVTVWLMTKTPVSNLFASMVFVELLSCDSQVPGPRRDIKKIDRSSAANLGQSPLCSDSWSDQQTFGK